MNEEEWLASPNVLPMLRSLGKRASGRKLRLFAAACVRRVWPMLTDPRSREAVEIAELYADGQIKRQVLREAEQQARTAAHAIFAAAGSNYEALAAMYAAAYTAPTAACGGASNAEIPCHGGLSPTQHRVQHAGLLRDVFGNPFRLVVLATA